MRLRRNASVFKSKDNNLRADTTCSTAAKTISYNILGIRESEEHGDSY